MQITVFGASGKVGSLVVEEALRRGYKVAAFVHSHDLLVPSNDLVIKKGDIYEADDVAAALQGSDAVVSCLGGWATKRKDVLTSAVRRLIPAMEHAKITRIVTLTGSGAAAPGEKVAAAHSLLLNALAAFPAGKVFRDGEEHIRLLAGSRLEWTVIRSPVMNNFGRSKYQLSLRPGSLLATVKRQAVANCMLDQLESDAFLRQALSIRRT